MSQIAEAPKTETARFAAPHAAGECGLGAATGVGRRKMWLRIVLQVCLASALLIYVATLANLDSLRTAWQKAGPRTLLLACAFFGIGALLSARRWQLLLRWHGVREGLPRLIEVYFIGLFCGLFLPTAAGGDVFRVYDVSRRRGSTAQVLLATMQDRLVGLGAVMLVGLIGTIWFHAVLPEVLVTGVVVAYVSGLLVVSAALHLKWLKRQRFIYRMSAKYKLSGLLEKSLSGRQALAVAALALATFAAAVLMHLAVCHAFGVNCGPLALCVVVSLVGIARMLPIAPNGAGVGEGTLVFLMGYFGVQGENAAPVALVLLAVQVAMSLLGGLLLLRRAVTRLPAQERRSEFGGYTYTFDAEPRKALSGGSRHAA